MATSNNFSEYYKAISDTELMAILDNPDDYQPAAVAAAKEEFASRQLSDTQIREARQPLIAKKIQLEKEKEKIKLVETKIKAAGHTFFDTINPIQSGIPSTEKTIRLIVIVLGGMFLFTFIKNFQTHFIYLKDFRRFPFESSFYLFPQLLLAVAVFTFWKRKTSGWTLLTIFLTFSVVVAVWILIKALNWKPSGYAALDKLLPRPSPIPHIIQLVFLSGTLYVMCKPAIREVFSVKKQRMVLTIGITVVVTFLLLLADS